MDDSKFDAGAGAHTRRGLIASAAALTVAPSLVQAATPTHAWTRAAYEEAMRASGRPTHISDAVFAEIQKRKGPAVERIRRYLTQRFGAADPRVVEAFQTVPREYYHYNYAGRGAKAGLFGVARPEDAYEDNPKPWAIGFGSALSDYLGQAYMTQLCKPGPNDVTLEIGTGSGFQSPCCRAWSSTPIRSRSSSPWATRSARSSRRSGIRTSRLRRRRRPVTWLAWR